MRDTIITRAGRVIERAPLHPLQIVRDLPGRGPGPLQMLPAEQACRGVTSPAGRPAAVCRDCERRYALAGSAPDSRLAPAAVLRRAGGDRMTCANKVRAA